MPPSVRVVLVNDYEVVVRGLETMLRPFEDRVHVVAIAPGALPDQDSDILLYDSFGAREDVAANTARALKHFRAERLVIYTWDVDSARADPSVGSGAAALISKNASAEELVHALEEVQAGRTPDPGRHVHGKPPAEVRWPGQEEGLTERESEVLSLLVQGMSTTDVAARIFVSVNTVRAYLRSLYAKTGVTTRAQAVLWGIDHGFRLGRKEDGDVRPVGPGQ